MADGYRITARPVLQDGGLAGVTFTADCSRDHREWHTRDCGQFAMAFARVMPTAMAKLLVEALQAGDTVVFPGSYEQRQFEREFAFEWSPVHLVAPPSFMQAY